MFSLFRNFVPLRTRVTVLRGRVARSSFAFAPGGFSPAKSARQHSVPVIIPDVARRTAAETVVQSPRREYDGREFRGAALQPRDGPLDSSAQQARPTTGSPSLWSPTSSHDAGGSLVQLVLRQCRGQLQQEFLVERLQVVERHTLRVWKHNRAYTIQTPVTVSSISIVGTRFTSGIRKRRKIQ